jgi:phage shock protein PspC (stress-responsive transcriptional regulator)
MGKMDEPAGYDLFLPVPPGLSDKQRLIFIVILVLSIWAVAILYGVLWVAPRGGVNLTDNSFVIVAVGYLVLVAVLYIVFPKIVNKKKNKESK